MAAEEQPPTDWIPGPDIAAVFRLGHAERMRAYMTGATAQLYQRAGELALPYHYDVLVVARNSSTPTKTTSQSSWRRQRVRSRRTTSSEHCNITGCLRC
jgi:hypothetical protein